MDKKKAGYSLEYPASADGLVVYAKIFRLFKETEFSRC